MEEQIIQSHLLIERAKILSKYVNSQPIIINKITDSPYECELYAQVIRTKTRSKVFYTATITTCEFRFI